MANIVDWVELAKQARAVADNAVHSASRGLLLKVATEYEEAARLVHSRT